MYEPLGRFQTSHRKATADRQIFASDHPMELDRISVNTFYCGSLVKDAR